MYWCVISKFFDSGKVKVNVIRVSSERKPQNEMKENKMCDEYWDYFDNYEEARQYAEDARNA